MIVSWKHIGLRVFYETGSASGINANHALTPRSVHSGQSRTSRCTELAWLAFPSVKGDLIDYWPVSISGNWRIIFRMFDDQVELVDYLDYH
jgi:proteic killer suppression protein